VALAGYFVGQHGQIADGIAHIRHARRGQNLGNLIDRHESVLGWEGTYHYDAFSTVAAADFLLKTACHKAMCRMTL